MTGSYIQLREAEQALRQQNIDQQNDQPFFVPKDGAIEKPVEKERDALDPAVDDADPFGLDGF